MLIIRNTKGEKMIDLAIKFQKLETSPDG